MELIEVCGKIHVLRDLTIDEKNKRIYYEIELPNFRGTGLALAGFLKHGETLDEFKKRKNEIWSRKW